MPTSRFRGPSRLIIVSATLTRTPVPPSLNSLPPFQELLDDHGPDVLGFLTASVGPAEADDCFQETFIAAMRAYPRLEHGDNLRGWLLTIAHHKAIDHHRSRTRRPIPVEHAEEMADAAADPTPNPGGMDGGDPEIWKDVAALPDKQRSAVILRFAADLPYREIGERIDCSEDAARRNVHEGIKRLRKELA
jgi:RNA polymerase sigma factor (sigma-70 family)